jgi:hypothetical protein
MITLAEDLRPHHRGGGAVLALVPRNTREGPSDRASEPAQAPIADRRAA